ncbi:hypothetical protein EWB00_009572, partial [Schistosoma japonicum]
SFNPALLLLTRTRISKNAILLTCHQNHTTYMLYSFPEICLVVFLAFGFAELAVVIAIRQFVNQTSDVLVDALYPGGLAMHSHHRNSSKICLVFILRNTTISL